jgi:Tol biopolymer transport system component
VSVPIAPGTRIGPYDIVGWIGAGGMGEVYRARDARLGRDVAIKLIAESVATDVSRVHRFEQEARAAGQLNHPNIVAVYDIGVHGGAPYIVSELLEGQSLRSRLSEGALPSRKVLDYGRQVAQGLAAAHDRGIVHRDVKPDNLFITRDGRVKILDFGIAKLTAAEDTLGRTGLPTDTAAGTVIGSAAYMSPEQVRGDVVDARSDIFSLGAVLYEMISGRPAFRRDTSAETMTAILKEEPRELAAIADAPALARIVSRCLEKAREGRFQSARDLAFGLDVLSGTQPTAALAAAPRRRWPAVVGITIVALSLAAAAASWLARRPLAPVENLLAGATFTPFTDFEGSELDAAISPDGKFVTFIADHDGPFHVYVKQVGAGSPIDLTPGAPDQRNIGPVRSAGFNGDGSEIWVNGDGSKRRRLSLMPIIGGTPRVFLAEHAVNAAWSPDGKQLVYFTYDGDPLILTDAAGEHPREILAAKRRDHNHFPAFSPDGRWIYYAHADQSVAEYDIRRIPAGGGTSEPLSERRDVRYLTPIDERTVLFVGADADGSGPWLWALDVDHHLIRRVSVGLERYLSVAASADHRRLVATVSKATAGIWSVPILDRVAEESDVTSVSPRATPRALAPRFGGDSMFYLSSSGGGDGLWRLRHGQASEVRTGPEGHLVEAPAVTVKGDRIAVVFSTHRRERITIVSADGADRQPLTEAVDVRGTSAWSPDGRTLVTGGSDSHGQGLFRIPVGGGEAVRLMSGPAVDPVFSPDGTLIVYLGEQSARAPLLAMRPDGAEVKLADPPIRLVTGGRGLFRFLPDGTGVVYVLSEEDGAQNFWLLDVATNRPPRQLTRLSSAGTISTFDITPDGTHIVFDRVRENSDVVLIDLAKPGAAAPGR